MITLHMMVGVPGSGKSTLAKKMLNNYIDPVYISRDEVRLQLNKDITEDYFKKEDEVFKTFVERINEAIEHSVSNIFIDATHISIGSRRKILNALNLEKINELKIWVCFPSPEICLSRNAIRSGAARVPETALLNMIQHFKMPSYKEFEYLKPIKVHIHCFKE